MAKRSIRHEYGRYITQLGKDFPDLVVLEADLKDSTQSIQFQEAYPGRYFDMGIAEQNMVAVAAGLSLGGKLPVAHSFACFISMRACEQVRTSIAYPKLNVKFVVSHGGISPGTAGTTHHAIEDIAIMRSIPNMTVLVPGDIMEMQQAVKAMLVHEGPVYMRLGASDVEDVYTAGNKFQIGKATKLRSGNDLTIVTTGTLMYEGVSAADVLFKKHDIKARVLQMASIKPIDAGAIRKAAAETGLIFTIEEHNIIGGLGGAVCEVAAEAGDVIVHRLGIKDHFCGVGTAGHLLAEEGLVTDKIVNTVLKKMTKKNRRK